MAVVVIGKNHHQPLDGVLVSAQPTFLCRDNFFHYCASKRMFFINLRKFIYPSNRISTNAAEMPKPVPMARPGKLQIPTGQLPQTGECLTEPNGIVYCVITHNLIQCDISLNENCVVRNTSG